MSGVKTAKYTESINICISFNRKIFFLEIYPKENNQTYMKALK